MFYLYICIAALLVPVSDIFFDVFRESYSWWLVPVLFIGYFLALIAVHALVLYLSVLPVKTGGVNDKVSRYYRTLVNATVSFLVPMLRIGIHSTGEEKVPQEGRFLLVCNHLDNIDPAAILHTLPNCDLAFIGKKEIYTQMPFVAKVMHTLNSLPIDRENNREAAKTIVNATRLIKDDKVSVVLFPEGYASKTQELLPMRNGAFKIAVKAGVPIVICTVLGTPQAVKKLFVRHNDIYFDILECLPAEKVAEMDTIQIGEYVTEVMSKNLEKRRSEHPEFLPKKEV